MTYENFGYRIGKTVKSWDICEGGYYGSNYGLTDLYPKCEENLRTLMESGEDFRTAWDCKKELLSALVMRIDGKLRVTVSAWTDDLWESDDLIYDAIDEATGREECVTFETLSVIRALASEAGIDDHTEVSQTVPDSYDALMCAIPFLADEAEKECDRWFKELVDIIKNLEWNGNLEWEEIAE